MGPGPGHQPQGYVRRHPRLAPAIGDAGGGAIVNMSTIESEVVVSSAGHPQVHYNASKGGVKMLTKALAVELANAAHPRERGGTRPDRDVVHPRRRPAFGRSVGVHVAAVARRPRGRTRRRRRRGLVPAVRRCLVHHRRPAARRRRVADPMTWRRDGADEAPLCSRRARRRRAPHRDRDVGRRDRPAGGQAVPGRGLPRARATKVCRSARACWDGTSTSGQVPPRRIRATTPAGTTCDWCPTSPRCARPRGSTPPRSASPTSWRWDGTSSWQSRPARSCDARSSGSRATG